MLKPLIALFCVTVIASFLLGVVYTVTEAPIAAQKAKTESDAINKLIPGTAVTESSDPVQSELSVNRVTKCVNGSGETIGYVISAAPKGYGGAIDMMIGLDLAGVVQGIQIIGHSETAGLGAKAAESSFSDQYKGKTGQLTVIKSAPAGDKEIDAIAGATITTQAVTDGVVDAWSYYSSYIQAGGEGQ